MVGSSLLVISGVMLLIEVVYGAPIYGLFDYIYVDAFNAFMIFILTIVAFLASIYVIGYLRYDLVHERITKQHFHRYYLGYHLFQVTSLIKTNGNLNNIKATFSPILFRLPFVFINDVTCDVI